MMYNIMHRSQIHLEQWQYETLKAQAEQQGQSISQLVREILSEHLSEKRVGAHKKLKAIEGIADTPGVNGRDHDAYLYGAKRNKAS